METPKRKIIKVKFDPRVVNRQTAKYLADIAKQYAGVKRLYVAFKEKRRKIKRLHIIKLAWRYCESCYDHHLDIEWKLGGQTYSFYETF